MSFILRRFVYFVAGFFGLLVYGALRAYPFAIDVALCVGFTVEVAGLVITARLTATPPLKPLPAVKTIVLTHLGFLAGVVVIERIYPLLQVLFPGGYTTRSGRPGSWALMIEVIAISVVGYGERIWLLRGPKIEKAGVWAENVINTPMVPAGQAATATPAESTGFAVGTLAPEFGASGGSTGYTSVTGLFSSNPQAAQVAQPVYVPTPVAPPAAPVAQNSMAAPVRSSGGYSSITGLVSSGPEMIGTSGAPGGSAQIASTGDDYEGFLKHMKEGKRPFRKPGMTVNEEFQAWLSHRARAASGDAGKKPAGLGRFMPGSSRA